VLEYWECGGYKTVRPALISKQQGKKKHRTKEAAGRSGPKPDRAAQAKRGKKVTRRTQGKRKPKKARLRHVLFNVQSGKDGIWSKDNFLRGGGQEMGRRGKKIHKEVVNGMRSEGPGGEFKVRREKGGGKMWGGDTLCTKRPMNSPGKT